MNRSGITYTIIFSVITTFIFVLLLSLANEFSKDKIAFNAQISEKNAFIVAAGIENIEKADSVEYFTENFEEIYADEIWKTEVKGEEVLVSKFSGSGLWGIINGVIAVNSSVDRIVGFELITHNETPGLGGRIEEDWFKEQFKNEKFTENFAVNIGTGAGEYDSENGTVDGVVGATRTSDSIEVIVLKEYEKIKGLLNKGGKN